MLAVYVATISIKTDYILIGQIYVYPRDNSNPFVHVHKQTILIDAGFSPLYYAYLDGVTDMCHFGM